MTELERACSSMALAIKDLVLAASVAQVPPADQAPTAAAKEAIVLQEQLTQAQLEIKRLNDILGGEAAPTTRKPGRPRKVTPPAPETITTPADPEADKPIVPTGEPFEAIVPRFNQMTTDEALVILEGGTPPPPAPKGEPRAHFDGDPVIITWPSGAFEQGIVRGYDETTGNYIADYEGGVVRCPADWLSVPSFLADAEDPAADIHELLPEVDLERRLTNEEIGEADQLFAAAGYTFATRQDFIKELWPGAPGVVSMLTLRELNTLRPLLKGKARDLAAKAPADAPASEAEVEELRAAAAQHGFHPSSARAVVKREYGLDGTAGILRSQVRRLVDEVFPAEAKLAAEAGW